MKVISLVNQKGGVGKTTTTLNLGCGLVKAGYKVLLVDLDPQCNLTQSISDNLPAVNVADCIINEEPFNSVIVPTTTEGLDLAPAGESMTGIDLVLVGKLSRETLLKRCLLATANISKYDFILIDTAPYVSLLTVNALVASDFYLVPTTAEVLPLKGIETLTVNVNKIRNALNNQLKMLGVVITQYDSRLGVTRQVEEILKENLEEYLLTTHIRINTRFKEAPASRESIFSYEESGRGSEDYMSLTEEILAKLKAIKED